MSKELEVWQFIASHLKNGEAVMLLVVAESTGSSPGRAGYNMAIAADGALTGSIGGGVMEVNLVEQSKKALSKPLATAEGFSTAILIEQVHKKNTPDSSGMICSGKQTIIATRLSNADLGTVESIVENYHREKAISFEISNLKFQIIKNTTNSSRRYFSKLSDREFSYQGKIGTANDLCIIGGGHCALALSELMSSLDFQIRIFDDRPDLNTIEKNRFAHEITIIDNYNQIGDHISNGDNTYVVVMTLGYKFDAMAIRSLFDHTFKYFGVLGSRAKVKTLLTTLEREGFDKEKLAIIRAPIGLPINSRTPEEIAISIAAEIISIKNQCG